MRIDDLFVIDKNVSMKKLLSSTTSKLIQTGDVLEGTITEIYPDEVRVDIKSKSEGLLPIDELKDPATNKFMYKKGDTIPVYVLVTETADGKTLLSYSKAQTEKLWAELESFHKDNKPVEVKIVEANRGGLIGVYKSSLRGFIPLSQLTTHHRPKVKKGDDQYNKIQEQLQKLLHSTLTTRIIEIDSKRNRLIFSERAAEVQNPNLINEIAVGQQLTGKISNILNFGLFIDLGGFDGFIHISEVSWNRINPEELFTSYKIGDQIKVVVIGIDDQGRRVSLSIKQLEPNPWNAIASKYFVGQVIEGTVSAIVDFGLFIELEEKFEGLLHISDLSLENKKLEELFAAGQKLNVKITSIDTEKKRLGLSLESAKEKEGIPPVKSEKKEEDPKTEPQKEEKEKVAISVSETTKKQETEEKQPKVQVPQSSSSDLGAEKEEAVRQFTSLDGIGKTIALRLYEAGYKTKKDLAKASTSELSLVPGIRKSLADKIIKGAKAEN